MSFLFTLLTSLPFPAGPTPLGWLVWFLLLGGLIYSLFSWRKYQPHWKRRRWLLFWGLLVITPFTALFIGLRFSFGSTLPMPGLPAEPPGTAMMLFAGLPWMLAGGFLGPVAAAVLGALTGLLRGIWDTYNLFSMLEMAFLGVFFAVNVRQRYRTLAYRWLRQPLISALGLIPFHVLFYLLSALFTLQAPLTARLDFALSTVGMNALAFSGEMLVAGIIAQVLSAAFPAYWGEKTPLQPSPAERSLETRFVLATGTFIVLLLLALLLGDWVVAGRAAREMLRDRLSSTAAAAADNVPFFLETGQNLAVQLAADARLLQSVGPELTSLIGQRIQAVPYFDQIFVLDASSKVVLAAYPVAGAERISLFSEEEMGLSLASSGVLVQIYSIPAGVSNTSARVSFLVAIVDSAGVVQRVLIGRTTLNSNPLTVPLRNSLESMRELHGSGMLLDENGRVLYSAGENRLPAEAVASASGEPRFYESTAADGTRQMVYYQPVLGRPWAIELTVPAQQAQQLALNIAMPLATMIILLAILALVTLRLGLRVVTGSLHNLAIEANRIAQGNLDHPLQVEGVDELGQLRRSFEQMRVSLQARLDELNRLLLVSQGVASSLEMEDSLRPVLDAIHSMGAHSVRAVLSPAILPETPVDLPSRFAVGAAGDLYAHLDDQILALAQKREQIVFPNLSRTRELSLAATLPQPASLLAVPLRHENRYYGVIWAGFEQMRTFTEADVRFVTTLAGQAALAVANAHLFLNVEVGRRQLEAIINSTPDPVLVTDHRNRLLLANRAAAQVLRMNLPSAVGQAVESVIQQKPLLEMLQATSSEKRSAEVILPDQRTYLATASSVVADGRPVGRVCILRDVTHFKELDAMKSEFVATVSHDLRSPLTLMRGYATMLEMVGELNDQQQGYVRKIIAGVENMSRLVNNLLDLGRIEVGVGLQVESVPVVDILERAVGALRLQASQKKIALNVELPRDMPHAVEADGALLHQAVYNLVENAIKYTPESGQVTLRTRSTSGFIIFEVEDTGIGIPPEDIGHLFEKFYRGKQREARAQQGTGLGLAIVRSIAERHGGRVWVESEVGKGSTFYLQIPLKQSGEPHSQN